MRITSRRTTFSFHGRIRGKLVNRRIGHYPTFSLAEARERWRAIQREADLPLTVACPPAACNGIAYGEMVTQYVELYLKPRGTRSWKDIGGSLRHPCLRHLSDRPASEIGKADINAALDVLIAEGKIQAAVNILRRLKMLFNWAAGRDYVVVNPCDHIAPPGRTVERDRVLSDDEIVAIWNATYELSAPYGSMYRSFFLTGQRRSEVATMRWCDIADGVWTIPREVVKKDRPHAVPLSTAMLKNLSITYFFGPDAYVFTTTGGKAPSSNFSKIKAELDRLSGVADWRIHDIRRTVRSKLAELGVPREIARKVLNHEDGKVDRIYNRHEYLTEKQEALEKWAIHLMTLVATMH